MSDLLKARGNNVIKQSKRNLGVVLNSEKHMRIITLLKEKNSQTQLKADVSNKENMVVGGAYKKTLPNIGELKMNEAFPKPPVLGNRNEPGPQQWQDTLGAGTGTVRKHRPRKLSSTEEMFQRYNKGLEQLLLHKEEELEKTASDIPQCSKHMFQHQAPQNATKVVENCQLPLRYPVSNFQNVTAAERSNSAHDNWQRRNINKFNYVTKRRPIGYNTMSPHDQPRMSTVRFEDPPHFGRSLVFKDDTRDLRALEKAYAAKKRRRPSQMELDLLTYNVNLCIEMQREMDIMRARHVYACEMEAENMRRMQQSAPMLRRSRYTSSEEELVVHFENMNVRQPKYVSPGFDFYKGYKKYQLQNKNGFHPESSESSNSDSSLNTELDAITDGPNLASNSCANKVFKYSIDELKRIGDILLKHPEMAFRRY